MRRISATGVALAVLSLVAVSARANAQQLTYEYVGKIVCGPQPQGDTISLAVVRGFYGTTVNVRNPTTARAIIRKEVFWTFPPGLEKQVIPDTVRSEVLGPNRAFATECREWFIRSKLSPQSFHEGLIVIDSSIPLDVIGVYTAASLAQTEANRPPWTAANVSSIHIDHFPLRRVPVAQ